MLRDIFTLFLKEVYESRRKILFIVLGLLVLPGLFVSGTVAFQQTLPEDIPIGIAPADEQTTEDDITVTRAGVAAVATPQEYDSKDTAVAALEREEVYLVILVPPNILDEDASAEFTLISDNSIVPLQEPADLTASILDFQLDNELPSDVSVTQDKLGVEHTLSEYLVAIAMFLLPLILGFVYVPYQFQADEPVFDRIRHESSLIRMTIAKLLFNLLLLIPVLISIWASVTVFDYRVSVLNLGVVLAVGMVFLSSAAIGTGVLFLTRFGSGGLLANITAITGIFAFGSILYPVGFFSHLRMEIARNIPHHYFAIVIRGHSLRDQSISVYSDWYLLLTVFVIASLVFCLLSIIYYTKHE